MRREKEWSHSAYRSAKPTLKARNGVFNLQYIPSLSKLRSIKEAKIRRIRGLVANNLYDTSQRQIATARRITELILAQNGYGN